MTRDQIARLPHPLARALHALLDEEPARSADELAELLVALVEYVAAVALCDYLDGRPEAQHCATDPSLNGWLVAGLAAKAGVEAGQWARWTQLAAAHTDAPAVRGIAEHVAAGDLDEPKSDLSELLRFRNDVMHGGFVAPLPRIMEALERLDRVFRRLEPLWALVPVGCVDPVEGAWVRLTGLEPGPIDPPTVGREDWVDAGAVLLVDEQGIARLALHPACTLSSEGHLALQHHWRDAHEQLLSRPAIRGFYDRYRAERAGRIDASAWWAAASDRLPPGGYRSRGHLERAVRQALGPGRVVRLVGPPGSGRSALAAEVARQWAGEVRVLPVEEDSVRMDPGVVRRWASEGVAAGVLLVVDDAGRVGTGLYASEDRRDLFAAALSGGATVLLVHRPGAPPPVAGDAVVHLAPWTSDELAAWGDPSALGETTGGHVALLAHPEAGLRVLVERVERARAQGRDRDDLGGQCLDHLARGGATARELAAALDRFTPQVERALRQLLDLVEVSPVPGRGPGEGRDWRYDLRPETRIGLRQGVSS